MRTVLLFAESTGRIRGYDQMTRDCGTQRLSRRPRRIVVDGIEFSVERNDNTAEDLGQRAASSRRRLKPSNFDERQAQTRPAPRARDFQPNISRDCFTVLPCSVNRKTLGNREDWRR